MSVRSPQVLKYKPITQPRQIIKLPKISATKKFTLSNSCAASSDAVLIPLQVSLGAKFRPFNNFHKKSTYSRCFMSWVEFFKDLESGSHGRIILYMAEPYANSLALSFLPSYLPL